VRFKRHAKNKLRRIKGTWREAESVVAVAVWVVVADDDPEVVITVFKEGRG
jgi:tellurite resistance protein